MERDPNASRATKSMALDTPVTTARLRLRPVCPADRPKLIALEADAEVMRYLNGGASVPEAGLADADFLTPRGLEPEVLAAELRESGAFIGWFALFDDGLVDGLKTAEIGYRLARSAWGQGYATEAAGVLRDWAFGSRGLTTLVSYVYPANHASAAVARRLGARLDPQAARQADSEDDLVFRHVPGDGQP